MSEDRYELFEQFRPLVFAVIGELRVRPTEEIVQAGLIGLWKAVVRREIEYGERFVGYAKKWIKGEILMELESQRKARMLSMYDSEGNVIFEKAVEYDVALYLEILETYHLKDFREYIDDQPERSPKVKVCQITFQFE